MHQIVPDCFGNMGFAEGTGAVYEIGLCAFSEPTFVIDRTNAIFGNAKFAL